MLCQCHRVLKVDQAALCYSNSLLPRSFPSPKKRLCLCQPLWHWELFVVHLSSCTWIERVSASLLIVTVCRCPSAMSVTLLPTTSTSLLLCNLYLSSSSSFANTKQQTCFITQASKNFEMFYWLRFQNPKSSKSNCWIPKIKKAHAVNNTKCKILWSNFAMLQLGLKLQSRDKIITSKRSHSCLILKASSKDAQRYQLVN